ncbi:hypothetical protein LXL04_017059 [Taraxacum kok-saghyz]
MPVEAFSVASGQLGEGLYSRSSNGKEATRDSSEGMLLAGGQNNGGWKSSGGRSCAACRQKFCRVAMLASKVFCMNFSPKAETVLASSSLVLLKLQLTKLPPDPLLHILATKKQDPKQVDVLKWSLNMLSEGELDGNDISISKGIKALERMQERYYLSWKFVAGLDDLLKVGSIKRNHSPKNVINDIMRIVNLTVISKRNYWSLGFSKRYHSQNKTVAGASRGYPTSILVVNSLKPI